MNCKLMEEHILDLATGAAPTSEMTEHMKTCPACAARVGELRATMSLLDEWQAPEPSPYFNTRLKARLREQAAAQPAGLLAWLRKPVLALGMAGLMAIGVVMFRSQHSSEGAQQAHNVVAQGPSAVADLQTLDSDEDLFAHFDILDDGIDNNADQRVNF